MRAALASLRALIYYVTGCYRSIKIILIAFFSLFVLEVDCSCIVGTLFDGAVGALQLVASRQLRQGIPRKD